jgi:hypothetical protein
VKDAAGVVAALGRCNRSSTVGYFLSNNANHAIWPNLK